MVLKRESKRYADLASTTYIEISKFQLLFPLTPNHLGKPFPNPAQQRKLIKGVINYVISENERKLPI